MTDTDQPYGSEQRSTESMEKSNNSESQLNGNDSEQRDDDGMERSSNNGPQLDGADSNSSPSLKRRKTVKEKRKATAIERVLTGVTKSFMDYQQKCEERFMKFEERRARDERAHEERLFQLLLSTQQHNSTSHHPPVNPVPHFSMYYNQSPNSLQCHNYSFHQTKSDE